MSMIHFNPVEMFTAAQLAHGKGVELGSEREAFGKRYILTEESAADLARGEIVALTLLFALDAITYDHDLFTVYLADAGATIAEGRMAGLDLYIDDITNDLGYVNKIAKNTAGKSGSAITITLDEAFATNISAVEDINVTIYDPNYCIKNAGNLLAPIIGAVPIAVDFSAKPYFWRQVSGLAPVIMTPTNTPAGTIMVPSATDGEVDVVAEGVLTTFTPIGICVANGGAANKLGMILLDLPH